MKHKWIIPAVVVVALVWWLNKKHVPPAATA